MRNIIQNFLYSSGIPYTKQFSEKIFEEHPNKNNMLGLSQMLKVYGLDMIGVKFEDKENAELPIPCILHINGGFVVATKLESDKISYLWNDNPITKEVSEFCQIWTGHALIAKDQDLSKVIEPYYSENKRKETLSLSLMYTLAFGSALALITGFVASGFMRCIPQVIDYVFSVVGLILSILLMQKQLINASRWGGMLVLPSDRLQQCAVYAIWENRNLDVERDWYRIFPFKTYLSQLSNRNILLSSGYWLVCDGISYLEPLDSGIRPQEILHIMHLGAGCSLDHRLVRDLCCVDRYDSHQ